eukprot:gnl/TRDRNA2_/TRDRNA2_177783_c0_seq13.p1 gnl/TRDRNA2_/TRDRNA2_177783_c0~~gnl/TRDRNA2_/TRDRNA2_177783_c0_seq13.p1  ORF type:complete len:288 (+),score=32.91 gnl/TRDRNA2_/TRDRNA2_177783_c0_seq13:83-865(+)
MARVRIPVTVASHRATQHAREHGHGDRQYMGKSQRGFGQVSLSGNDKDIRKVRITTAARTINDLLRGLSGEQVGKVVQFLEPEILAMLRKCMSGSCSRVSHDDELMNGCGHRSIGNGGGQAGSTAAGRGLKDSKDARVNRDHGNGAALSLWPLKPEDIPGCTDESSEQVAFQAGMRTPWKLMGRPSMEGAQFRWHAQPPDAVSEAVKADVRRILSSYAKQYGIRLSGADAVKLALLRYEANKAYWISFAGGVSSAETPGM